MRVGKRKEGGFLPLLALPLMKKVPGKGVARAEKENNNIDHMWQERENNIITLIIWVKSLVLLRTLCNVSKLMSISITILNLLLFFQEIIYLE